MNGTPEKTLQPGSQQMAFCYEQGQEVEGKSKWIRLKDGGFTWEGSVTPRGDLGPC
ncbi:hypothetical protein [Streptomyces sp. NPDC001774]